MIVHMQPLGLLMILHTSKSVPTEGLNIQRTPVRQYSDALRIELISFQK